MNIKEELIKLKEKISSSKNEQITKSMIDLDSKVDSIIKWYYDNLIKNHFSDMDEYRELKEIRNFIEKMAVWYELRYPEYEINRLLPGSNEEDININDVMFENNPYINGIFEKNSDVRILEWSDFYNANVFIKSLPCEERYYFKKPSYKSIVYLGHWGAHVHLTKNGIIENAEGITNYTKGIIKDEELEGQHIKKVVELFNERNVQFPKDSEIERVVKANENWIQLKEEILNCVMYIIIERGGNRIGPRRAFLFAKEFKRNIDIPMMYGVDRTDPGLKIFINEYIKAGGHKDLECFIDYFDIIDKNDKVETITIQELILTLNNYNTYTPEEHESHQRLVNILASQIDQDIVKQEKIKKLRLERKLENSKRSID